MNAIEKVDAKWMGSVFGSDPNLTMPERPRVPPEIVVVPVGTDGLLFAGAEDLQVVRGASARQLVPTVLAVLDGTRTLDEICAALPAIPGKHVRDTIALLKSRGLIEDGGAGPTQPGLEEVGAFIGRIVDVSRKNRDRHESLAHLAATKVVITGPADAVAVVAETLRASGVGDVRTHANVTPDVSLALAIGPDPASDALIAAAFEARIPVLPLSLSSTALQLGPLLDAGRSYCPRCHAIACDAKIDASELSPDRTSFLLELATLRVFHLLAQTATITDHRSTIVFTADRDGDELRVEPRPATRTPGCARCGLGTATLAPEDPALVAWRFHTNIEMPPKDMQGKRDYQMHFKVANVQLAQQPADGYDGAPALALPPPTPLAVPAPWTTAAVPGAGTLDLAALATLLGRTAGFVTSEAGTRRVAPTGGGLGSPALYLAAIAVEGLAPAIYHYHPTSHTLERIADLDTAALGAALGRELRACEILGVARLGKVYQKYREFAYRVVHFDAGVAINYVHAIAAALGLPARELSDFDDGAIADLLRLPTMFGDYTPTFAIGLGASVTVTPAELPRGEYVVGAADVNDATMWKLIDASRAPRTATIAETPTARHAGSPTAAFERTLLGRHAVREYQEAPVPAARLREVVALAIDAVRERVAAGAAPLHLVPWVAVRIGSDELPAGLYEAGPGGELTLRRAGLTAQDTQRLNSQDNLAIAPVSIFMAVDLDHALATRGARGYREACEMAGAAVGRAWLAAVSLGLGGCAGGGVIPSGLRDLADLDGFTRCPMLSFHLGLPQ